MKCILETKRLLLRKYGEEDAESFYRSNSDREVMRYTGDEALVSVEQPRTILRNYPIADYTSMATAGGGVCCAKRAQ